MRLTLASSDANPLGGKVCKNMVTNMYPQAFRGTNAQPFAAWYGKQASEHYHPTSTTYIILTPILNARQNEVEDMYRFVEVGNTLVVAANYLSVEFADKFGIQVGSNVLAEQVFSAANKHPMRYEDTRKYLPNDTIANTDKAYGFFYERMGSYIISDSSDFEVTRISFNHHGVADGVELVVGEGRLMVVANAEAFTNYFLLTANNYLYADEIFQRPGAVTSNLYWDEFYHRNIYRPDANQGILSTLLSIPPLRWAFWLLLILVGIFLITAMIRRQRMIPVKDPNTNATVAFTQTIARLYFAEKDNNNIAQKMIQHFLEHIRGKYYMPTHTLDEAFATLLAHKTNVPAPEAQAIVATMASIQSGEQVTDDMLLLLNRDITRMIKATL